MINSALQTFANKVQQAGCISFGDVKRLKRDILPDEISSRDEAELLLILAQSVGRTDRAFGDWLVAMTVDFVVWGMRPTGTVDAETAAWLSPSSWASGRRRRCGALRVNSRLRRTMAATPSPPLL